LARRTAGRTVVIRASYTLRPVEGCHRDGTSVDINHTQPVL